MAICCGNLINRLRRLDQNMIKCACHRHVQEAWNALQWKATQGSFSNLPTLDGLTVIPGGLGIWSPQPESGSFGPFRPFRLIQSSPAPNITEPWTALGRKWICLPPRAQWNRRLQRAIGLRDPKGAAVAALAALAHRATVVRENLIRNHPSHLDTSCFHRTSTSLFLLLRWLCLGMVVLWFKNVGPTTESFFAGVSMGTVELCVCVWVCVCVCACVCVCVSVSVCILFCNRHILPDMEQDVLYVAAGGTHRSSGARQSKLDQNQGALTVTKSVLANPWSVDKGECRVSGLRLSAHGMKSKKTPMSATSTRCH